MSFCSRRPSQKGLASGVIGFGSGRSSSMGDGLLGRAEASRRAPSCQGRRASPFAVRICGEITAVEEGAHADGGTAGADDGGGGGLCRGGGGGGGGGQKRGHLAPVPRAPPGRE